MNPLPSQERPKDASRPMPALPLNTPAGSYSTTNRRIASCPIQRIYPWLLFASTAVAATFCLAYITKPVVINSPASAFESNRNILSNVDSLKPKSSNILPEKSQNENAALASTSGNSVGNTPASPLAAEFEETNIRIQHVLDAESPSGDVNRIVIDVPVLYRSRNLRWTQAEATEARSLLERLATYQENVRTLRNEGTELRDAWNSLMSNSIPGEALRADSPSLPANQQDLLSPNISSDTRETINIQKTAE